jgi:hypothetical protein
MILTAHQPVYLPWLGLFHKIALADAFVSFDQVQYVPKDFISRNRIKTPTGAIWLTVPAKKTDHFNKKIAEIEVDNSLPWRRKHWRTLQVAYSKAPFFKTYAPFFEDLYARDWTHLADLDVFVLEWLLKTLDIRVPVKLARSIEFSGQKSELVLDMCRKLHADCYIFGALGRDYADVDAFRHAGVRVLFQDYIHPVYPQLHGDFVSHLSVIDLLFNCGGKSRDILMSGNIASVDLQTTIG